MTTATFYKNGFLITGHTRKDICSELSMFAWTVTNIILNISSGEYVTDETPGYGHFIFDHEDPTSAHIFSVAKQMIPVWADKYDWNDFVDIHVKDELLRPKGIVSTETA